MKEKQIWNVLKIAIEKYCSIKNIHYSYYDNNLMIRYKDSILDRGISINRIVRIWNETHNIELIFMMIDNKAYVR